MKTVVIQNWEERERGWGARPDGFTIHVDRTQRDAYVDWYYKKFNNQASAPDEYTCVYGEPITVEVDDDLFARIEAVACRLVDGRVAHGIWGHGNYFNGARKFTVGDVRFPE